MHAAGVPTGRAVAVSSIEDGRQAISKFGAPVVVKADGLTAGKGVAVCDTIAAAERTLAAYMDQRLFGDAGATVLVEEYLAGQEVSILALTDGHTIYPLAPACDYKRAFDGDEGPNTGGMGAYSPVPFLSEDEVNDVVDRVHRPVLGELARRRSPFVGLLYAGLMLTDDGPRVLEFNCRFGDPETQSILPLLENDLFEPLAAAAAGRLGDTEIEASSNAAVTVVLASPGYPEAPEAGARIGGLEAAEGNGALVFHAGTALREGELRSAGGRVLDVTSVAPTSAEARERVYEAIELIDFPDAQFRRDIALKAVHVSG